MRISTNQLYYNSLNSMMNSASKASEAQAQLTSGKRITTAGDDPAAMSGVLALKQQAVTAAKYQSNIDQATARLNSEEVSLNSLEDLLQNARDNLLQGGNGSLSAADRQSLADETRTTLKAMLDVANSRDESGNHLFGGYQTDQSPFVMAPDGSVSYQGDQGQRQSQVGDTLRIATSDSGQRVFQSIPNPLGDFVAEPQYASGSDETERVGVRSATIVDRGSYLPQNYTLAFDDYNADGMMEVDVLDAGGNSVMGPVDYAAGQTLSVNGVEIELGEGNPQAGDQIVLSPQSEQDIFGLMQQAIDWLESNPQSPEAQATSDQQLGMLLDSMESAFNHVTGLHGEVGSRLNALERQTAMLEDGNIVREEARSRLEEVDYTQAVLDYNKQMVSLQTSQQSYAKVNQLSLFNYL